MELPPRIVSLIGRNNGHGALGCLNRIDELIVVVDEVEGKRNRLFAWTMVRVPSLLPRAVRHASTTPAVAPAVAPYLYSIQAGETSRSRLQHHYQTTLSHSLLYELYSHPAHAPDQALPNPLDRAPMWSPLNPYAKNRPPPRPKGNRYLVPNPSYTSPSALVRLESITLESMNKSSLANKNNLLPLIMAFQAITGEPLQSHFPDDPTYGPGSSRGIIITKSTKKSASFKIRPGAATGIKITLKGPLMYSFLETLNEFVLPRLKTFSGVALPSSAPRQSPSATSGVVSFGIPPEAMGLFPAVEMNLDQYMGKIGGMNMHFCTSAKGRGAQDQARVLLSGFGVPFVKR